MPETPTCRGWRPTGRLACRGLVLAAAPALAQDDPARAVKIGVPFAPGGSADVFDRLLVQRLGVSMGQSFVVENTPGGMSCATSGPGTPHHMAGELFKAMAGVSVVRIPYRGSSGARTDALGGPLEMMFDAIPTMAGQIEAGKVKAIASPYTAASSAQAAEPARAAAFIALLVGDDTRALRATGGFEF